MQHVVMKINSNELMTLRKGSDIMSVKGCVDNFRSNNRIPKALNHTSVEKHWAWIWEATDGRRNGTENARIGLRTADMGRVCL